MEKAVKARLNLQIAGGSATPAPPVGSLLGQQGVKIQEFCAQFNAMTAHRKGETVPVVITIYTDRSFAIQIKTSLTSELIKKAINIPKGSSKPGADTAGQITWADIAKIAQIKLPDFKTADIEQAKKIVAGTARSMGVTVTD